MHQHRHRHLLIWCLTLFWRLSASSDCEGLSRAVTICCPLRAILRLQTQWKEDSHSDPCTSQAQCSFATRELLLNVAPFFQFAKSALGGVEACICRNAWDNLMRITGYWIQILVPLTDDRANDLVIVYICGNFLAQTGGSTACVSVNHEVIWVGCHSQGHCFSQCIYINIRLEKKFRKWSKIAPNSRQICANHTWPLCTAMNSNGQKHGIIPPNLGGRQAWLVVLHFNKVHHPRWHANLGLW